MCLSDVMRQSVTHVFVGYVFNGSVIISLCETVGTRGFCPRQCVTMTTESIVHIRVHNH